MITNPSSFLRKRLEPAISVVILLFAEENRLFALEDIAVIITYLFVPLMAILYWKKMLYVATRNLPLLLLYGFTFCSVYWSTAPAPTESLLRALLFRTVFAIYLASRYSPRELLNLLAWVFGLAIIPNIVLNSTNGAAWQGIYRHKNYLARIMAVGALLFASLAVVNRKRRWFLLLLFLLAFALLFLSGGKTSLALFPLTLSLLPLYWVVRRNYKFQVTLLSSAVVIVGISAGLVVSNLEFIVVDLLGKSLTLSGRFPVWSYLIDRGLQRPFLGYGFGAFWSTRDEVYNVMQNTWYGGGVDLRSIVYSSGKLGGHAHSGFIDLFLSLGLIGIFLFLLTFVNIIWGLLQLATRQKTIEPFWMLMFIMFMVPLNATITNTLISPRHIFWILYVAIGLMVSLQLERLKKQSRALASDELVSVNEFQQTT